MFAFQLTRTWITSPAAYVLSLPALLTIDTPLTV